ncbi:uncharacterized protein LOC128233895 isoform X2 [Mya arenaria]|uniref:uncharacterized protein LOC128233895 isoform X2 n=1 Tax=Mya arenaria TaxID=6604 RepID=UPI0022E92C59|nr:uncharacterized protein LOC128233895 isoform X2 [Mya arenaria]
MQRLYHLTLRAVTWIMCVLLLDVTSGLKEYRSCLDVKNDLGSQALDGEYVVFLPWKRNVAITVYCYGLQTSSPQAYITINSGKTSNFAAFYENVGSDQLCADKYPREVWSERGRTEYTRISVDLGSLAINTGDFTFTNTSGPNKIRYGEAGDKYASGSDCSPMGTFEIDLTGTPFTVSSSVSWVGSGSHSRGNVTQIQPAINDDLYVGCFADRTDRVLGLYKISFSNMTIETCRRHCAQKGQDFSGLEYYSECFCGSDPQRLYGSRKAAEERCNYRCTGNSSQVCGGHWYISVYKTVVQQVTGRCGGYPGRCYPTTAAGQRTGNLVLDIMDGQHVCITNNPCLHEGRCLALSASNFRCICYPGYTGDSCEIVDETVIEDGQRCPAGYHAETCTCFEASCNGARFDGDMCVSSTGKAQVTCRPGDPAHVMLYNKEGSGWVECPKGSKIVGCTYWASYPVTNYQGQGVVDANTGRCTVVNATVNVQARCKEYFCGCENGAHCNQITGKCECDQGYYGDKCETFDYCSYYEEQINQTACSSTGVCTPVYKYTVTASGGDRAADRCVFPFDWGDLTYNTCVQDNAVGPPFACAGEFSLSGSMKNRRTYIDLGQWSPGPRYTVAAWVSPWKIDTMRQTVVGGASECNDFGINFNSGTFRGYLKLSKECTRDLDTGPALAKPGTWYMIAITSNASHASIYLNGELKETNTVLLNHIPTTSGFWIGSAVCCTQDYFRGQIKTVKAWNRALTVEEINRSMYNGGVENSTYEALYDGLVGHWELGDTHGPTCSGSDVIDHGGADWNLRDGEFIMGIHCNISRFVVPAGATVLVKRYDGTSGGFVDITALDAQIDGYIDAVGAGYRGGVTSKIAGDAGVEGESYTGAGSKGLQENRGGGGGGIGGSSMADGTGRSGGGGGYGEPGAGGVKTVGDRTGLGAGGRMYGDPELNHLYMGSGGGSGGNAKDLTTNPNGGRGGNGGGVVRIYGERSIIVTGVVSVAGEAGQGDVSQGTGCMGCPDACDQRSPVNCRGNSTTSCWDMSGPGGGGSGGTIFLSAKLVNVGYQKLWAMGGEGGAGGSHCCGGAGGRGRIRIDSVIMKGTVNDQHGILKAITRQEQYMDHSQYGQKQINYKTTIYGNEVYRGCFRDDVNNRTLAVAITDTVVIRAKQTPDYCKQLCRKRNFMYSGTEGGSLCFCDNHLDMSRKVADSDCNTTCSGNPLWNCGGTRRIQVFGPPPSAPAVGHGILPSCRPWCVTADATTNDPKWGMCELGGHEAAGISSWDMQCKCPPGRTGTGCDQICPSWTYGDGCRRNCTCNVNNTAVCESSAGTCQCKPGFIGPTCEETCPPSYFGQGCKSMCSCSPRSDCDPATGTCWCKPGWYGTTCNYPCPEGRFGANCSQNCAPCNHGTCSPFDGQCRCYAGYKLPFCAELCDMTNFGQDCEQDCACSGQPCHPITGTCICGPGYLGDRCQSQCPQGTWGQNCLKNCACQHTFGCDPVDGTCNCGPGFVGERCEIRCPDDSNSFGQDCRFQLACVLNRTTDVDIATGSCDCAPGFYGSTCEKTCSQGYYGYNCTAVCGCKNGGICNSTSGDCTCAAGFTGSDCSSTCPPGRYGVGCAKMCLSSCGGTCNFVSGQCACRSGQKCTCPANTAGSMTGCTTPCACVNGRCQDDGTCVCEPGWAGNKCDTPCPSGTYGVHCSGKCTCIHGRCDAITGQCTCNTGIIGNNCDQACTNSTFGQDCRYKCPGCGAHSYPGCDVITGSCVCSAGYTGSLCNRPCPANTYGDNCSSSCLCQSGGVCDNVSGKCNCPPGFFGDHCEAPCPTNTYGAGCAKTCDCGPYGASCSRREGLCTCKPGFIGVKCRETCPPGTHGQNCTLTCSCDPITSLCSPIDGHCLCKPGYTGSDCQNVCTKGTWGRNCSQTCNCGGRGTCNAVSGRCNCQPGYKGNNCELQCTQDIYYGPNCENLCSCNGAHCDHRDGTCRCPPGKIGHHCEKGCPENYFGFMCAQACGCQNGGKCDPVSGACTCQPGWAGQLCTDSCPTGYYGVDCSQVCQPCYNGGSCDTFSGTCVCAPSYTGPSCNTSLIDSPFPPGHQKQQSVATSGVNMSSGHFAGMLVGIAILFVVGVIIAVVITRRCSHGTFNRSGGAMKFNEFSEEELENRQSRPQGTTASSFGFDNPVHVDFNEIALNLDKKSVTSDSTSGVASGKMDSDEEDSDNFFKDSDS